MSNPQGFLMITIPDARVTGPNVDERGFLSLECITLLLPAQSMNGSPIETAELERDVWLIIRVNNYEMTVSPTQPITYSQLRNTYSFSNPRASSGSAPVVLYLQPASDQGSAEDLETLQVLFEQYGLVHTVDGSTSSNEKTGRLVLIDEADGHIVGSMDLGGDLHIQEDDSLTQEGREKDPVIVDIPENEKELVTVTSVSPDETDGIRRVAGLLSRGILYATSTLNTGMTTAADYYISRAKPSENPVEFSDRTRDNMRRIHKISGKAVQVTAATTKVIHDNIDWMASSLGGSKSKARSPGSSDQKKKPRLLNRLLMSTDLLLTTLEQSATSLAEGSTSNVSRSLDHKYGADAAGAATMIGGAVKNVGVVYIDARGVGRRALLRRAGKRVVKARLGGGKEVILGEGVQGIGEKPSLPSRTPSATTRSAAPSPSPSVGMSRGLEKPPLPPRRPSPAPYDRKGA